MHKKFSKIIYPLLALMLALSMNSMVFAQTGDQQGGNQQDQTQQDEQNQDDDNQQNQQDVGAQQGDDQQGDQQQGAPQIDAQQGQQGTQQQGQQFGAQQGAQQGVQQNQFGQQGMMASGACAQTYVVQQGDTLGDIANRFLGSIDAYQQIADATNAAASNQPAALQQTGQQQGQQGMQQQGQPGATQQQGQQGTMQQGQPSATQQGQQGMQNQQQGQFTRIDDPNVIQVGQVLCIPEGGQLAQGQSTFQQGDPSTFQPTPAQQGFGGDLFDVPEDMAKVIVENLSSRDLIVDISMGPQPQSQWVGPGEQHTFVIQPGEYNLTGHEPGGEFAIVPGQLDLASGTVIGIACQEDGRCQSHSMQDLMALQQQGMGTMGQQQQQGQQQGTMQQGQQQGTMQQGQQQGTMQQGQQQGTQQQQDDGTEGIPQQDPQDNDVEDNEGTGG